MSIREIGFPDRLPPADKSLQYLGRVLGQADQLVKVYLWPKPSLGIRIYFGLQAQHCIDLPLTHLSLQAQRATCLVVGNSLLRTPEHFLAAHLAWPGVGTIVWVQGEEFPIGDGSAFFWYELLEKLHGCPPENLAFAPSMPFVERLSENWEGGYLRVKPRADKLMRVHYTMERGGKILEESLEFTKPADLWQVLQARTFIFSADWERARAAGLLEGARPGCGLLLEEDLQWTPREGGPLRHPLEPLRHKVLDLLGDLALLGLQLPRFDLSIHNGGHAAHHRLLRRIINQCPP